MNNPTKGKYSRDKFLASEIQSGTKLWDWASANISDLKITRPLYAYSVKLHDLARPDRISYNIYKDQQYWWIILKYNNINDPFNDLFVTQTLLSPNEYDIQEWFMKKRNK